MGSDRAVVAAREDRGPPRGTPLGSPPTRIEGDLVRAQERNRLGRRAQGVGLFGSHRLAPIARLATAGSLGEAASRTAQSPGGEGPDRLVPSVHRWLVRSGPKRGAQTGPNPTDRAKTGTKRHLVTEKKGIPLVAALTGANVHDVKVALAVVQAIPPIQGRRGRPRRRPQRLYGDKGYDSNPLRQALREMGIQPEIARRRTKDRLGKYRWVVERAFSWINQFRRLRIRYERLAEIHLAFLYLGCAVICWRKLIQWL